MRKKNQDKEKFILVQLYAEYKEAFVIVEKKDSSYLVSPRDNLEIQFTPDIRFGNTNPCSPIPSLGYYVFDDYEKKSIEYHLQSFLNDNNTNLKFDPYTMTYSIEKHEDIPAIWENVFKLIDYIEEKDLYLNYEQLLNIGILI